MYIFFAAADIAPGIVGQTFKLLEKKKVDKEKTKKRELYCFHPVVFWSVSSVSGSRLVKLLAKKRFGQSALKSAYNLHLDKTT